MVHLQAPASHRDVIERWPSLNDFGSDIGASYEAAKAMRRRNSVPVEYWSRLISAAERRGLTDITYESLALMQAKPAEVS